MNIKDQTLVQSKRRFEGLNVFYKNKTFFITLSLTVTILLVYSSVFSHQFQMHWDDQWVIFNFYTENGLTPTNLYEIFTQFFHGQYSPINQLTFTLIYAAAGNTYDPVWFHSYSVILHILNVFLTYFFIRNLLTASKGFSSRSVLKISFCTAFIMAVHPFLVEAVAWMAASKILLYAFFYLLALNSYLFYLKTNQRRYLALIFVFFILSFGSKEQAVTLPACLLLIDYVLKRDLRQRKVWLEKIPFVFLSLIFCYVTLLSQKQYGVGLLSHFQKYPLYQNIIFGSYALTEYLVKCLMPIKLNFLYLFPNKVGQQVPWRFWMYPPALFILFITLRVYLKSRWVLFALLFFILHLILVLHIIPISRLTIVADRYAYIASIGVFFFVAYLFDKATRSVKYKQVSILLLTIYIAYLGIYTNQRAKVWHDNKSLKKEIFEAVSKQSS